MLRTFSPPEQGEQPVRPAVPSVFRESSASRMNTRSAGRGRTPTFCVTSCGVPSVRKAAVTGTVVEATSAPMRRGQRPVRLEGVAQPHRRRRRRTAVDRPARGSLRGEPDTVERIVGVEPQLRRHLDRLLPGADPLQPVRIDRHRRPGHVRRRRQRSDSDPVEARPPGRPAEHLDRIGARDQRHGDSCGPRYVRVACGHRHIDGRGAVDPHRQRGRGSGGVVELEPVVPGFGGRHVAERHGVTCSAAEPDEPGRTRTGPARGRPYTAVPVVAPRLRLQRHLRRARHRCPVGHLDLVDSEAAEEVRCLRSGPGVPYVELQIAGRAFTDVDELHPRALGRAPVRTVLQRLPSSLVETV